MNDFAQTFKDCSSWSIWNSVVYLISLSFCFFLVLKNLTFLFDNTCSCLFYAFWLYYSWGFEPLEFWDIFWLNCNFCTKMWINEQIFFGKLNLFIFWFIKPYIYKPKFKLYFQLHVFTDRRSFSWRDFDPFFWIKHELNTELIVCQWLFTINISVKLS